MRKCEDCGGEHPQHIWEVIRWWWNEAPRSWGDRTRFAFALAPLVVRYSGRAREWWAERFVRIRMEEIARRTAQSDIVIQLRYDDPRAAALMMYLNEGQEERSH